MITWSTVCDVKRGDLIVIENILWCSYRIFFSNILQEWECFLFPFYGKGKNRIINKFIQDLKLAIFEPKNQSQDRPRFKVCFITTLPPVRSADCYS